jgi:hypothetical protein
MEDLIADLSSKKYVENSLQTPCGKRFPQFAASEINSRRSNLVAATFARCFSQRPPRETAGFVFDADTQASADAIDSV